MVNRILKTTSLLAIVVAAAACGGGQTKPTTSGDGPETTTGPTATPPPTPPKCESLDEKCAAKPDTLAKVKTASLLFKPGKDWIYAQGETYTIAQFSEDGAAFGLGSYTPDKDAKKDAAARDAGLAEIEKAIGTTPPKDKINWKSPDDKIDANGFKLNVWTKPGAERGKKKGVLFIVHGPLDVDHTLVGAGFVEETDTDGQKAIDESIKSIIADSKKKP